VARGISGIVFRFCGSVIEIVDCGLISIKDRGPLQNRIQFLAVNYFFNGRKHRLGPWFMEQHRTRSMVDRPPWLATELNGAQSSGHFGAWWHCYKKGEWRG
jgi:hypothetical protein